MPGPWALTMSTIDMQLRSLHKAYCACVHLEPIAPTRCTTKPTPMLIEHVY